MNCPPEIVKKIYKKDANNNIFLLSIVLLTIILKTG